MKQQGRLMRECLWTTLETRNIYENTNNKLTNGAHVCGDACGNVGKRWQNFQTIENIMNYNGKAKMSNARMRVEMLERTENLQTH